MKPIIGIISNNTINDTSIIYSGIVKSIEESGGEPLGLVSTDTEININILNSCDGFIFQGGNEVNDLHLNILEYAYKRNKPILGICMGLELIAIKFFGIGSVVRIENIPNNTLEHYTFIENNEDRIKCIHKILIDPKSILHPILGDEALVNSRHIKTIVKVEKPFIISAKSEDGLIEAIEYINENHFILGVQFHPENLESMKPLFDLFITKCRNK